MLVFYPDFDVDSSSASGEVVLLLDTSESMKGEPLNHAQRIAMQVLQTLQLDTRVNIILFGSGQFQLVQGFKGPILCNSYFTNVF